MPGYYPPVGFHFRVEVLGVSPNDNDLRFTEVTGLSAEVVTEEMPEGGENRFVQKYPTRTKYPELVLKRGMLTSSAVMAWIEECVGSDTVSPKNLDVQLLNEAHEPLMTWHVVGAFPTRWSVSDLNASASAVVVESMQLYYRYFTVDRA
mgnify:CR=1 FL=1